MGDMARLLIISGAALIAVGIAVFFLSRIPGFGKLPGDIFIQKGNFSFYFPLVTCLVLSIIISVILNLWPRK